ncbi:MAG: hypothetical protein JWN03_1253 [Nocardia sp.]|uniref:DUF1707 SHOCT-like domain-containing protein n=1 Tax=Nocardia sp. TaxID=1821 RepID=UPI00261CC69A|nr:DUF1707 domain-containing protein [Nocardia sp.]MCU1640978.1 hypothetical protein [Nocardia sp.]
MEPHWNAAYLRASDADRECAIEGLKQSFQEGRITADELSERIGQALNARTFGDLDLVLTGLPVLRPMPPLRPLAPMPVSANMPVFYGQRVQRQWNGMGVTAFVLGIFGFICGITAIPAVALGAAALAIDAKREDKAFAIGGIATGGTWLLLFAWLLLLR